MAIIRSGRIHKGAELDAELVVLLVKQLQTLSGKKSYLGELSWQAEKSVLEKVNIDTHNSVSSIDWVHLR